MSRNTNCMTRRRGIPSSVHRRMTPGFPMIRTNTRPSV